MCSRSRQEACKVNTMHNFIMYTVIVNFNSPGVNIDGSLHSPLPALSAPLTLKEYTTPVCSVSTMYCDVVFMFVMLLVLVLVTSTWYTTTHWLSRDQVRLTDDSVFDVLSILKYKLVEAFGGPKDRFKTSVKCDVCVPLAYLIYKWLLQCIRKPCYSIG